MSSPEVTIDQGTLRGSVGTDIRGNSFFKFQGIPYAKPPLGNLRFKSPQPPEKWSGIWDATKEGDICYSKDPLKNGEVAGSENCLFLNVYTKKISNFSKLSPVLVWIHGGGFIWGSGNEEFYGPNFLLTENIVLVNINYRLGLLGFLNFEDPTLEIPGNAAFKDQILALKWVQKNISKFGGDPNNVTIFGESAGSASVHLLMLSPLGKGLFHKVIAQSATALNSAVYAKRDSKSLAKELNLEGADEKQVYATLLEKSPEELLEIQEKLDVLISNKPRFVGFVVEKNSKDPFLDKKPIDVIKSGTFNHVPFIAGYTNYEGFFFEIFKKPGEGDSISIEDHVPWHFEYEPGSLEFQTVVEKIKKFYFGDEGYTKEKVLKKFDLIGDAILIYGTLETIEHQYSVSKAPTYLYRVSVDTDLNFAKKVLKIDLPGVSHLDDVGYLFNNFLTPEIKPGSPEDIGLSRFVKLWTNFAKFGNPTPDSNDPLLKVTWKPVTGPNFDFLDIGQELVALSNPDETERFKFWKQLYSESPGGQNKI